MAVWRLGLSRNVFSVSQQLRCSQTLHFSRYISSADKSDSSNFSWLNKLWNRSPGRQDSQSQTLALVKNTAKPTDLIKIQQDLPFKDNSVLTMEKFIPLTRQELVKRLAKETKLFSPSEIRQLDKLALSFDAYISRRFYIHLEEMKLLYDVMDPDKDTIQTKKVSAKELLDDEYWLLQKLEMVLQKANFYKIQRSDILKLLQSHDVSEGVHVTVDPLKYTTLRIWTRGMTSARVGSIQKFKHQVKKVFSRHKNVPSSFDKFTRVFVAVRSKNSTKLHLKIFKDVPCNELEYLIPDGKIEMSKFDKGFISASVFLGSVFISLKLFTLASNLNVDYGLIGLALAGLIGAKGWTGYKNKRNKYLVNLSRILYFKTVANNRGVLTLLTDRAEDEEFKEALLAYMFLMSPPNRRGVPGTSYTPQSPQYHTKELLQEQIENWLQKSFKLMRNVSFDVEDAILKLDQMGLLVRYADNTFAVVPIDVAIETLPSDPMYSLSANDDTRYQYSDNTSDDDAKHYPGWQ